MAEQTVTLITHNPSFTHSVYYTILSIINNVYTKLVFFVVKIDVHSLDGMSLDVRKLVSWVFDLVPHKPGCTAIKNG